MLTVGQIELNKFEAFYGMKKFVKFTSFHPVSVQSNLIFSHLYLGLQMDFFPPVILIFTLLETVELHTHVVQCILCWVKLQFVDNKSFIILNTWLCVDIKMIYKSVLHSSVSRTVM
jgi:hypothetical protein